jgi:hypothetical protein
MLLKLHPAGSFDEVVVIDTENRFEIPHTSVDFKTIEVDDVYADTASVIFVRYPLSFGEQDRRRYRQRLVSGSFD